MTRPAQRCKTGIPGLDTVLNGGLIPGQLYLVDGHPGAGKTTFALQFLLEGLKNGEKCTYVTLSETRDELEAGAQSHGWTLAGIDIVEMLPAEAELGADEELTLLLSSDVELGETTRKVLEAIERTSPDRLVFDSLSELRLLAQNSLRHRRQILALKQVLVGRRCTVIMLDDRTSGSPDAQLHSIAHGVISLESHAPTYGHVRREVRVAKFRGSDFVSGFHDFAIRKGGLSLFPRLIASQHTSKFKRGRLASGVAAMDTLMGGGVDRGTSTLLIGPPGSGKSTLALQYAAAEAAQGGHAATFVFDETKSALLARSEGVGLNIKQGLGAGEIEIRVIDPVEVSPGEFAHLVCRSVEEDKARVIIIDSLNGYLNAMPQNNFLTAQLHEMLSYLNNQGVATFMTMAQTGMIGAAMSAPVDASYLADNVILLRYFELQGEVRKAISVLKKRTGGHESSIRELSVSGRGFQVSEPLLNMRAILSGVPLEIPSPSEGRRRQRPGPDAG